MNSDTAIGGAGRDFPSTCWSRFSGAAGLDAAGRRAALEELSRGYWKPIYAYVGARWAKTREDAKDLTQSFFAWMLESDFLSKADPARGRFRAFLKVALKHFLEDERERRSTLKRGGDRPVFAIDAAPGDEAFAEPPDGKAVTPEEAMDEAWKAALLTRAEGELQRKLLEEGAEICFRVFRDYYLAGAGDPVYRDVAARHGISEADVHNHLRFAKKRYRAVLVDLVSETVATPEELQEEMRSLFGGGAG